MEESLVIKSSMWNNIKSNKMVNQAKLADLQSEHFSDTSRDIHKGTAGQGANSQGKDLLKGSTKDGGDQKQLGIEKGGSHLFSHTVGSILDLANRCFSRQLHLAKDNTRILHSERPHDSIDVWCSLRPRLAHTHLAMESHTQCLLHHIQNSV